MIVTYSRVQGGQESDLREYATSRNVCVANEYSAVEL